MSKLDINVLTDIVLKLNENLIQYEHFIETGTYIGETIYNLQPNFKKLSTIELNLDLYTQFNNLKQEKTFTNVNTYTGDSIIVLPGILLTDNSENTIFWLDAHYDPQASNPAQGIKQCPLIEECTIVDNFCKSKKCIILIDDYGQFNSNNGVDWSGVNFETITSSFKNYTVKQTHTFNQIGSPPYWFGDIFALLIEKNLD